VILDQLRKRRDQVEVRSYPGLDAVVLDLDNDRLPRGQFGPMDLADGGRCEGVRLPLRLELIGPLPQLDLDRAPSDLRRVKGGTRL
jgi:hypothetical protein